MDKKFMRLVARALYVLILICNIDHPYLHHGKKVDAVLLELDGFISGDD